MGFFNTGLLFQPKGHLGFWSFCLFLFICFHFMSMCNEQFLSTSPLIQLREVLDSSGDKKVQHNLACGPLILLYIIHPIYSWNSNTIKCVFGQTFHFPAGPLEVPPS